MLLERNVLLPAYYVYALYRNVMICARVQVLLTPKRPPPIPAVTPFSAAQRMGLQNQSPIATSLNGLTVELGSGLP